MKKSILKIASITTGVMLLSAHANAQFSFANKTAKVSNQAFHSGCAVGVADMNGDGLDDIIRLNQGHDAFIEYQQVNGQFISKHIGDFGTSFGAWGMTVADIDHNGYKDILAGDYGPAIMIMKTDANGLMGSIVSLPSSNFFMQNANFMDVNNDGWEDVFACDDNAMSHIYTNNGAGGFVASSIINFDVTTTDDSGNYGSIWSDFDNDGDVDLYIAKCRQSVSSNTDGRRINVLMVNNGNGTYTSQAATYGIAIGAQTWTANFADIDNDGDFDLLCTNHDVPSQILENDGTGHFTDITAGSGFVLAGTPIESVLEDFDNDGFVDILISGSSHEMFRNNHNKTFTKVNGLFDANSMESYAIGDLNHDGKIDVYASYANIYTTPTSINDAVWMNSVNNGNNFLTLNLEGTQSTKGALGARAYIYGAWGVQTREVRASESYGTVNSFNLHFGLGTATSVDSVVVKWPKGIKTVVVNPAINQFITIIEGQCVSPDNVVTYSGSPVICASQTKTLTANSGTGYSYLWTNSATTQSINATSTGDYAVTITQAGNACSSTSPIVSLAVAPTETYTIAAAADTVLCQGDSVLLTASNGGISYTWSNGGSGQTTYANASGAYSVAVQGACQVWSSNTINVNVHPSPAPTASDVNIPAPGTANLTATGNSISWFTTPTGGTAVATGANYTTPTVSTTTTFYAQDEYSYGGSLGNVGQKNHYGTNYSGSTATNANTSFNVLSNCTLKRVKVYTDAPGVRIIELKNAAGTVIQSASVNIPMDSSWVTLNFPLTPGTGYRIGTNAAANNTLLGFASPRLMRSTANVAYPYNLSGLVSITGSDQGSTLYYYFYDWEVEEAPMVCVSPRTPVTVTVGSTVGINDITNAISFNANPNPAHDVVVLKWNAATSAETVLMVTDVLGKQVYSEKIGNVSGEQVKSINVADYKKGVYFVTIKVGNEEYRKKLIVE